MAFIDLLCCGRRRAHSKDPERPDERAPLLHHNEIPATEEPRIILPDQEILQERLSAVVRTKAHKMVNISSSYPFRLATDGGASTGDEHSVSRSTTGGGGGGSGWERDRRGSSSRLPSRLGRGGGGGSPAASSDMRASTASLSAHGHGQGATAPPLDDSLASLVGLPTGGTEPDVDGGLAGGAPAHEHDGDLPRLPHLHVRLVRPASHALASPARGRSRSRGRARRFSRPVAGEGAQDDSAEDVLAGLKIEGPGDEVALHVEDHDPDEDSIAGDLGGPEEDSDGRQEVASLAPRPGESDHRIEIPSLSRERARTFKLSHAAPLARSWGD